MKKKDEHTCEIRLPRRHAPPETMRGAQRAAFRNLVTWSPLDYRIRVFISPDTSRVRYSPPDAPLPDPLEREIKNIDASSMIKLVVARRIRPLTGELSFVYVDRPEGADVRIGFMGRAGGSWSVVGNVAKYDIPASEFSMCFGWLNATVIMHEFCHCLGMIHEHQNPVGGGIPWDEEALYAEASRNNWSREQVKINYLDTASVDSTNAGAFDRDSIMLYPYASHLTRDGSSQAMNARLSKVDTEWIMRTYRGFRPDIHRSFYPDQYPARRCRPDASGDVASMSTGALALLLFLILVAVSSWRTPSRNRRLI